MKRNRIFGAGALLMAGAAVGAGATITQHAMADDGPGAGHESVTMVNIGADGTAVSCTFTGADAAGLVPAGPAVVAGTGTVQSGVLTAATGDLPVVQVGGGVNEPSTVQVGEIPVGVGGAGVVTVSADADGTAFGSTGDVREGTAEECAAMHADGLVAVRNAVPTDNAAKEAANSTEP